MEKMMDLLAQELSAAFEKAGYDSSYGRVTVSNRPDLCEYQCNGAMAGAKAYHKAPIVIAQDVVEKLSDSQVFSMAEAVKPGFINLKIKETFLSGYLQKMHTAQLLGAEKTQNPKTIIIDYGGPNVAKPLHVGHLRSAIIGESIKRMGRFLGHEMIGDVHLGDWGLQMGLIITELKHRQPELVYFYSKAKIFCLPSRQDGFGLVLFQAMICGLPLVYSHYTGGPDLKKLVNDHEFLFEMPEYTVESLSETLLKALKKAEQQPRNCVRSYLTEDAVSNISWQAYGQRYNEFLLKVTTNK